eukprot:7659914-Alexandrium_andersonii.AAC.1
MLRRDPPWSLNRTGPKAETSVAKWQATCFVCQCVVSFSAKPGHAQRGWPKVWCPGCSIARRVGAF